MKKLLFNLTSFSLVIMAYFMLFSCGENLNPEMPIITKQLPSTEVYFNNQLLGTRAINQIPAYFYLRIDNRIPNLNQDVNSTKYYPQDINGNSIFSNANMGYVDTTNINYNKSASYPFYIYDTSGINTLPSIKQQPSLIDILNANYMPLNIQLDSCKVIWYIVKHTYGKVHVDGVLTTLGTKDISEIPSMKDIVNDTTLVNQESKLIETDIHHQIHKDWDEIKTSIHIRKPINQLVITIPIESKYVVEKDDFALRTFVYNEKVFISGNVYEQPIKVMVEHLTNCIRFTVDLIDPKYIEYLMATYGDGATIEIHSYLKDLPRDIVDKLISESAITYK